MPDSRNSRAPLGVVGIGGIDQQITEAMRALDLDQESGLSASGTRISLRRSIGSENGPL
jgi:hypothetical protein